MRQYTQTEMAERYSKLPPILQNMLASTELPKTIREIGTKHRLHIDQLGSLLDLVQVTLAGVIRADAFYQNLTDVLPVEREKLVAITTDVNAKIFMPIRRELQKIQESNEETETLVTPESEMPASFPSPTQAPTASQSENNITENVPKPVTETPTNELASLIEKRTGVTPQDSNTTQTKSEVSKPAIPNNNPVAKAPAPSEYRNSSAKIPNPPTPQAHTQETTIETPMNEEDLKQTQAKESDVSHKNTNPKLSMIPDDVKKRINSDPYRESID